MFYLCLCFGCTLHVQKTNQDSPDIGAGLWNHQHSNHRDGVCPQDDRDVKTEAEHNGQPHPAKAAVVVLLGTLIEQDDNQQTQQCKRDVAQDTPAQRCIGAGPGVLREEAQQDAQSGQQLDGDGDALLSADVIAAAPDVVQQDVKDGHGDGGDKLSDSKGNGEVFQSGGT